MNELEQLKTLVLKRALQAAELGNDPDLDTFVKLSKIYKELASVPEELHEDKLAQEKSLEDLRKDFAATPNS